MEGMRQRIARTPLQKTDSFFWIQRVLVASLIRPEGSKTPRVFAQSDIQWISGTRLYWRMRYLTEQIVTLHRTYVRQLQTADKAPKKMPNVRFHPATFAQLVKRHIAGCIVFHRPSSASNVIGPIALPDCWHPFYCHEHRQRIFRKPVRVSVSFTGSSDHDDLTA